MKFTVAVILALAMAVNARQLTWSPEEMAAMGYSTDPTFSTYVAPEDVAPPDPYYKPYYHVVKPTDDDGADPYETAPYYYGKPYYPVPVVDDADVVDPYHGYYVKPIVDDSAAEDPIACFFKKVFTCDAPEEISPTCGTETCTLPNLCLTVKKTVKKMIEVPVTECADPKLLCKEIKKECGDTECAYNEVCKVDKVCEKVYGYPYPEVDEEEEDYEEPYYPYPYPYPYPEEDDGDDDATSTATAKAVATSDGGPASASAVAKAGSKRLLGAHGKYPGKYPYPEVDPTAEDPAYGPYKVICKDTFSCEEVDPKVCKTVTHEVCVKKDPKTYEPGYYNGYLMDWTPGYEYGQPCGGTVCDPGSFCATCEVEVCKDAVMEKDAAQCGYDAKGVPTFCPAGHMCTELCAPIKKYIAVEVEVPVCVDPTDETYADEVAAAATECGPHKCLPGYECNSGLVKVCGGYPEEVDPEEEKLHGYYFYYDPKATAEDVQEAMPGYHFYPHDAAGDAAGCGYYLYPQLDIEVEVEEENVVPYYYYPSPVAEEDVDPYHYYNYYASPVVDDTDETPYYYGHPYVPKVSPEDEDDGKDPYYLTDPYYSGKDYYYDKHDPWVASSPSPKAGKVQAVSKSNGDSVYVWGSSETTGDASGSFDAHASSGDDTYADITGGSGLGDDDKAYANVDCDTASADGKVAGCDGTATHN